MNVSIIICTYNRCLSLRKALESLSRSVVPSSMEWEVLVVDNNSNDETRDIVKGLSGRHSERIRYLLEPIQGKSHALNRAINESSGEILAFLDDDVTVEPQWLINLTSVLQSGEYAGAGGRILPAQTIEPPRWLALQGRYNLIGAVCPSFDFGESGHDLKEPPLGANMAFRRQVFQKYGTFRLDLGPSSRNRVSSEDTEFGRRVLAGGDRIRYVPSATVYHEIHAERLTKAFFLRWWSGLGRGSVRETPKNLTATQAFKVFARTFLTALQGAIAIDPQRRFYCHCRTRYGIGKLAEALQRMMEARKTLGDRPGEIPL